MKQNSLFPDIDDAESKAYDRLVGTLKKKIEGLDRHSIEYCDRCDCSSGWVDITRGSWVDLNEVVKAINSLKPHGHAGLVYKKHEPRG